ncbi:hypothetical protein KI387_013475, partial [Taxus chinensis]
MWITQSHSRVFIGLTLIHTHLIPFAQYLHSIPSLISYPLSTPQPQQQYPYQWQWLCKQQWRAAATTTAAASINLSRAGGAVGFAPSKPLGVQFSSRSSRSVAMAAAAATEAPKGFVPPRTEDRHALAHLRRQHRRAPPQSAGGRILRDNVGVAERTDIRDGDRRRRHNEGGTEPAEAGEEGAVPGDG